MAPKSHRCRSRGWENPTSPIGFVGQRAAEATRPCPLRALRAKRLDLGGARIVQQLLVFGRLNRDQRDLAFVVVVDPPAVALCQRRNPKMRVTFAHELLAFGGPDRLRDVMERR